MPRQRLAKKPKCRIRTKPRGKMRSKKRRKNSSAGSVRSRFLFFMSGVAPAKRDLVLHERNEPVVGNGHAMGVSAKVAKDLIRSAEGRLTVDDPVQRVKLADQTAEEFGLSQTAKPPMKLELSGSMCLLKRCQKFAAEQFAESCLGEEEAGIARWHPMRVVV
jgi:hypothetical protein